MFDLRTGIPELDPGLPLPLALVQAGIDLLRAANPADEVPDVALLTASVLLTQVDQLKALSLAAVADVDTRQLFALEDSPSARSWVAEQFTSMHRSEVALARDLARVPLIAARVAEGGLHLHGAIEISRALNRLRRHVDRGDGLIDGQPSPQVLAAVIVDGVCSLVGEAMGGLADEHPMLIGLRAQLVEIAASGRPEISRLEEAFLVLARYVERDHLRSALGRLVDAVLPNLLEQRAADAHTNRSFELRRDDSTSTWDVRGRLDLQTGELLHTVLGAAMATDPANPLDTAAAQAARAQGIDPLIDLDGAFLGPGATEDDQPGTGCRPVPRSWAQRRHDALRLALTAVLEHGGLGIRGKHRPQLAITVPIDALHHTPGALPAVAASGAAWPVSLVKRVLCDSAITRFVLSLGNKVIETSHTERTLKHHERRIKHEPPWVSWRLHPVRRWSHGTWQELFQRAEGAGGSARR